MDGDQCHSLVISLILLSITSGILSLVLSRELLEKLRDQKFEFITEPFDDFLEVQERRFEKYQERFEKDNKILVTDPKEIRSILRFSKKYNR